MISDRYKELVNAMRSKNGMAPAFPAAATPDIVDATDETGDGGLQDALESLRRGVRIANGEKADDAADDEKKNELLRLPMLSPCGVSPGLPRKSLKIPPPTRSAPRWRRTRRLSSSIATERPGG